MLPFRAARNQPTKGALHWRFGLRGPPATADTLCRTRAYSELGPETNALAIAADVPDRPAVTCDLVA